MCTELQVIVLSTKNCTSASINSIPIVNDALNDTLDNVLLVTIPEAVVQPKSSYCCKLLTRLVLAKTKQKQNKTKTEVSVP